MPAQQTLQSKSYIQTDKVKVANSADNSIIGSNINPDESLYYYESIEERPTASDISSDLKIRLIDKGVDNKTAEIARLELFSLLVDQYPEVEAVTAVRILRQQFRTENSHGARVNRYEGIPKYSTKSGRDPLSFFREEYSDLLAQGPVMPSHLQRTDPNLYIYLKRHLARPEAPTDEPKTIPELLETMTGIATSRPLQKRIQECATILDTDVSNAARFFANVRPDLVRGANTETRTR